MLGRNEIGIERGSEGEGEGPGVGERGAHIKWNKERERSSGDCYRRGEGREKGEREKWWLIFYNHNPRSGFKASGIGIEHKATCSRGRNRLEEKNMEASWIARPTTFERNEKMEEEKALEFLLAESN